jgi:hypothetical protein
VTFVKMIIANATAARIIPNSQRLSKIVSPEGNFENITIFSKNIQQLTTCICFTIS